MDYYITYTNQGKSERTPTMPDKESNAKHNVELLRLQGATSIIVHSTYKETGSHIEETFNANGSYSLMGCSKLIYKDGE